MSRYELRTLGGLSLLVDGRPIGAPSRKPLAVLAIAAVAGPLGVTRHRLISLLWPDLPRSRANHVLSQTLYALRRDFGEDILATDDSVVVDLSRLSWDLDRFREQLRGGDVEGALEIYRGPFLEGVSFTDCDELDAWIALLRASLAAEHASAVSQRARRTATRSQAEASTRPLNQRRAASAVPGRAAMMTVGLICIAIAGAVTWQGIASQRRREDAGLFDELSRKQVRLLRERERSPRGRIFIESPINRSGNAFLDSVGRRWSSTLAGVVDDARIAHVVPRDSVVIIEREVAQLGWATPLQRLERARAFINVMTVISGSPDTPRVFVAIQRLHTGRSAASRELLNELRRHDNLPPLAEMASRTSRGTETVPFVSIVAPRDSIFRRVLEAARQLSRAFDDVRFCDIDHHDDPQALPWCWASENKPVVVKGYYGARADQRLAKGTSP